MDKIAQYVVGPTWISKQKQEIWQYSTVSFCKYARTNMPFISHMSYMKERETDKEKEEHLYIITEAALYMYYGPEETFLIPLGHY